MRKIVVTIPDEVFLLKKIQPNNHEILAVFWKETFTLKKLSMFFELVIGDTPSEEEMRELYTKLRVQKDFGLYSLEEFDAL